MGTWITDADASLFREAVADAIPARAQGRISPVRPAVKPVPVHSLRDQREALRDSLRGHLAWGEDTETGEALTFLRQGLPRQILRKLRNGHWAVQAELDLHGLRVDEAKAKLRVFLAECRKAGVRCVRVVHGKGLRSRNREPVLKFKVRNWLMQREEILAFIEARAAVGGSGAVIVLLAAA
jgi:DNA-nicking Smr family endonuclease